MSRCLAVSLSRCLAVSLELSGRYILFHKNLFIKDFKLTLIILVLFLAFFSYSKTPSKTSSPASLRGQSQLNPLINRWNFIREIDGVYTYKLKSNKKIIGTFHSQKSSQEVDWGEVNSREFLARIFREKRFMMSLIDVSDWKPLNHSWKKKKGFFELAMNGSYTDPKGRSVFFYENHLYFPKSTWQILVVSPSSNFLKTKTTEQFIQKVRKFLRNK